MIYLKDIGFVVKRVNLGDADRFVTIFTKDNGKVEVLAKGVRKITSRRTSHTELLNLVKFHSLKTSKNFILTEIQLLNSFEIRKSSLKQCEIAFLVCELIDTLCPFGLVNKNLFRCVFEFLKEGRSDDEAILGFETSVLSHLGYWDANRKFYKEKAARGFIENLIEKRMKSEIGNL